MKHVVNESTKLIVEILGTEYVLHRPKLGAVIAFEESLELAKKGQKSSTKVVIDMIVSCGLPEAVCMDLDQDQMEELTKALTPAKKNS